MTVHGDDDDDNDNNDGEDGDDDLQAGGGRESNHL